MSVGPIHEALKRMGVMQPDGFCRQPPADTDWNAFRHKLVRTIEEDGYEVYPGEVYWWKNRLIITGWAVISKTDNQDF